MDNHEVDEIAARLEATTSEADAVVKIVQHGGGPDESHIVANRAGYLRLGASFLRAATAPLDERGAVTGVDTSDLIDEDADIFFAWMERREDLELRSPEQEEYQPTLAQRMSAFGCTALIIGIGILLLIGMGTVIGWLWPR